MSSQFFNTGPAEIYTGTGASGALEFLGFTETGVDLRMIGHFDPVMTDYGGIYVPTDMQFMAEEAFIDFTLTRYQEAISEKLAVRLSASLSGNPGNAGSLGANLMGTFMVQAAYAIRLLIYGIYAPNNILYPNMRAIYNFYAAMLVDDFRVPISVRAKRPSYTLRAIPTYTILSGTGNVTNVSYILYDGSASGMPGPS